MGEMLKNYLKIPVDKRFRKLKIVDIRLISASNKQGVLKNKIEFVLIDPKTKNEFIISDAMIRPNEIHGLWFTTKDGKFITSESTIGKVLRYYKCSTLEELSTKTIDAYPDKDNFLVILGTKLNV